MSVVKYGKICVGAFGGADPVQAAGIKNSYTQLPESCRAYISTRDIYIDQNNKRMILVVDGLNIGIYYLLDTITESTNIYGYLVWVTY